MALAALVGSGTPARADAGLNRNYQVRDDDAARFAIVNFRRHASRGEWRPAIQELQKLFDAPPQRGVVVAVEGAEPRRYESAWRAALRLFDALPADGRAAWEELQRRPAEELLARGIAQRRDADLAAAARRYPARDVRRRAHDALAHLATSRGDFDRAGRELESLLEASDEAAQPQVWARLAFVRARAGEVEGLRRIEQIAKPHLDATVTTGEGSATLGAYLRRLGEGPALGDRRAAGVRLFSGDAHGSGVSDPPPQTDKPGWAEQVGTEFVYGGVDAREVRHFEDPTYRPVAPVVAHGAVFVNNGLTLTAREVSTGRPLWQVATALREPDWRENPVAYHTAAVAHGVCYAALATRADVAADVEREFYGRTILYPLAHRALHAVDVRSGEVLWAHDASRLAGRADAEEIEAESVASAPLVVGDDLLVLAWRYDGRYEARLVCYDRRTGATRWRTSLVHGQQEMNLFGRPVKELSVPPLAELDGVVYAATGVGLAAAVDRVTGGIVWLTEYPTIDVPPTIQWYETRDRPVSWRPSPTSATRTAVVFAPLESAHLVALDPRTGARLWQRERQSAVAAATWFLGVTGGRAYALGTRLFAFDLATGRDAWTTPEAGRLAKVGVDVRPATGAGILTPDAVYAPTSRGLVKMDARTGAFVELRAMAELPRRRGTVGGGNLVSADGAMVVVSQFALDCYYRFEDMRERIDARIAAAPDDPQLRLEAGEMYRGAGRLDDAIASYDRGLAAAAKLPAALGERTDRSLRRSLVDALLARARLRRVLPDGPGAFEDLRRAADVARERGDAVRALFALADCAGETGRDEVCDAALRRIADEFADVQTTVDGDARADAAALAAFRLGRRAAARGDVAAAVATWLRLLETRPDAGLGDTNAAGAVRAALAELETTRPEVAGLLAAHARASLDDARRRGDAAALQRIARTSPSPDVAVEAALALAESQRAARRPREAAAALELVVARRHAPERLARILWELAGDYRAMDETARERVLLRRLLSEVPSAALPDGRAAGEAARAELAAPRFRDAPAAAPDPRPPLAKLWENLGGSSQALFLEVQGTLPRALDDALLFLQEGQLRCVVAKTGETRWAVPVGVNVSTVWGTRTGLVLAGEEADKRPRHVRLDGISPETGRRLWTRRLRGAYNRSTSSLGMVHVLRLDADDQGEIAAWVTAIAADTGEVLAERKLPGKMQPILAATADAVVVAELTTEGGVRRRVSVLDGATLAPRGVVDVEGPPSPFAVCPPGSAVVVTQSAHDTLTAVDVTTGGTAWTGATVPGASVKDVLAVPGGVVVSDTQDRLHRFDAATGKLVWTRAVGEGAPTLSYSGEDAEGDLVVATLVTPGVPPAESAATAVGLDAATGEVRWRTTLPLGGPALPRPEILQGVVAYELIVRKGTAYDSRVAFLSRADGRLVDTLSHPSIGKTTFQRVDFQGPWVVLWAPTRADVAVFSGNSQAPK